MGKKILVVDDQMWVMESLVELLTAMGHNAIGVTSFDEMVEKINEPDWDMVITDYDLRNSRYTGQDVLIAFRYTWPKTERILISGLDREVNPEDGEFISKGRLDLLLERVGEAEKGGVSAT